MTSSLNRFKQSPVLSDQFYISFFFFFFSVRRLCHSLRPAAVENKWVYCAGQQQCPTATAAGSCPLTTAGQAVEWEGGTPEVFTSVSVQSDDIYTLTSAWSLPLHVSDQSILNTFRYWPIHSDQFYVIDSSFLTVFTKWATAVQYDQN